MKKTLKTAAALLAAFIFIILTGCGTSPEKTGKSEKLLTLDEACRILKSNLPEKPYELHINDNGEQTVDGRDCYSFQVYSLSSQPIDVYDENGKSGSTYLRFTYAWAFVDKRTGEVFKGDVTNEHLIPFEEETYQIAYAAFLKDMPESDGDDAPVFSLWDFNGSGIPQLIVTDRNEKEQTKKETVYSYDRNNGEIRKIGECESPNSYAGGFRFSDNPEITGLFSLKWGGGIEHYGYLSLKYGELVFEQLYVTDRTGEIPEQKNVSDNTELINESVNVFAKSGDENVLKSYLINEENINKVILESN